MYNSMESTTQRGTRSMQMLAIFVENSSIGPSARWSGELLPRCRPDHSCVYSPRPRELYFPYRL